MPRPFGRPGATRKGAESRNQCKTIRLPRERKTKAAPEPTAPPLSESAQMVLRQRDEAWATPGLFAVALQDNTKVGVTWTPCPEPGGPLGTFEFRGLPGVADWNHVRYVAGPEDRPDQCSLISAAAAIAERIALRDKMERLRQEEERSLQGDPVTVREGCIFTLRHLPDGRWAGWTVAPFGNWDLATLPEGAAYWPSDEEVNAAASAHAGRNLALADRSCIDDTGHIHSLRFADAGPSQPTPIVVSEAEQQAAAKRRKAARKGAATCKGKVVQVELANGPATIVCHPDTDLGRLEPKALPGAIERDAALEAAGVPRCPCCGERDRCRQEKPAEWWCSRCTGWLSALSPPPGKHSPDF